MSDVLIVFIYVFLILLIVIAIFAVLITIIDLYNNFKENLNINPQNSINKNLNNISDINDYKGIKYKIKKLIKKIYKYKVTEEDTVIDYDETYYKIIKPDGTEYYRKKPNPAERIKASSSEKMPYISREILTPTEKKFWFVLEEKCKPYSILICPKVRMEDFLEVNIPSNRRKIYNAYRNKIKSRHIDFILCNKNMKMLAGIELDDKSHLSTKAEGGDNLKNAVFNSIKIPLYRIKTEANYSKDIDIMLTDIFK